MERDSASPGFGTLLRRYRLDAGLSQEALAERAQLSLHGISALERGYRRTPQRETLELLAGALALSGEQRREFEASAGRASSPRRRGEASITVGPWPSAESADLPLALTRFVGRETELEEIAELLRENRLVTLTGAGGVGKTQTALRAAAEFRDKVDAPVCFVELAPIGDPSFVAAAIANAFGLQEVPNHSVRETLVAFLKNKTTLIVFDNCEHVIAAAATIADSLLRACPNLRILATSREPLRAAGERRYRLPSLDEGNAMALFADRARAADAYFKLTDNNRQIVRAVCLRLDGIPLAIELAAAQTNMLSIKEVAARLDDHFCVLTGGERTAPPRQQTMRAAIEWSYDLLSSKERGLFENLTVFAAGCTLSMAEAICTDEVIEPSEIFELLSSLERKSIVLSDSDASETRYRLLEPFRQYAAERLIARGSGDRVSGKHAEAYLLLAQRLDHERDYGSDVWRVRAEEELANFRAALQWALTDRKAIMLGQRIVGRLSAVWAHFAISEGQERVEAAIAMTDGDTPSDVMAELYYARGFLSHFLGIESAEKALRSSEMAAGHYALGGDDLGGIRARVLMANALAALDRDAEASSVASKALDGARRLGNPRLQSHSLRLIAILEARAGNLLLARCRLAEAVSLLEKQGAFFTAIRARADLDQFELEQGNLGDVVQRRKSVIAEWKPHNSWMLLPELQWLSTYLVLGSHYDEAQSYAREYLERAYSFGNAYHVAGALRALALAAVLGKSSEPRRLADAARMLAFATAQLAPWPCHSKYADDLVKQALASLRASQGETLDAWLADGADLGEDQAVALAERI